MWIVENITRIREHMHAAAARAGRNAHEIDLIAVTKGVSADRIGEAYGCGLRLFGENRVQEFEGKRKNLQGLSAAKWHMIGHLQTNKVAQAVELFDAVDSVDSVRLAQKINVAADQSGNKVPVLIEINVGGEAAKSGVAPGSWEFDKILSSASELKSIEVCGLMTVPPYDDEPGKSRPHFRKMKELFDAISRRRLPNIRMEILSMGMSHDFEIAIEEGATCIRIGTAIFGERKSVRGDD